MENLLRAGRRIVDPEQIRRISGKCTCRGDANRITPPKLTGRTSEFCGEVIGIDVVYPFVYTAETRKDILGGSYPALLIADCLSRFAICSSIRDLREATLTSTLVSDWIRPLGKPRRIISDNGPPGMTGIEWGEFPHAFCIQLVRAPKETPQQNGLAERVVRSLKIALKQLLLDRSVMPSQSLVSHVTMARNHFPHTVTGIPPALAMTGRSDLLDGRASTAWNHDPHSVDPAVRQLNSTWHILNARNDIITADAERALVTCGGRNLPDRSQEFRLIGPSVQIASRNQWVGCFRVVGHTSSNLIIEKGKMSPNGPSIRLA